MIKRKQHMFFDHLPYIGIVCIAKREQAYIYEFIDYHISVGVNAFYIYDNDDPNDVPYRISQMMYVRYGPSGQLITYQIYTINGSQTFHYDAFNHFITTILPTTKEDWFAFIDLDEFLCPVQHKNLQLFLKDYGHLKAIGINWRLFGANGILFNPQCKVLSQFTRSMFHPLIKTFAHRSAFGSSAALIKSTGLIQYSVHKLTPILYDLTGKIITGLMCFDDMTHIIRINHYAVKSWEEFKTRCDMKRSDGEKRSLCNSISILLSYDLQFDVEIFKHLRHVHKQSKPNKLRDEFQKLCLWGQLDFHTLEEYKKHITINKRHSAFKTAFYNCYLSIYEIQYDWMQDYDLVSMFLTEHIRLNPIFDFCVLGFDNGMLVSQILGADIDTHVYCYDVKNNFNKKAIELLKCCYSDSRFTLCTDVFNTRDNIDFWIIRGYYIKQVLNFDKFETFLLMKSDLFKGKKILIDYVYFNETSSLTSSLKNINIISSSDFWLCFEYN